MRMRSLVSSLVLTLVCAMAVTSGCSSDAGVGAGGGSGGGGGGGSAGRAGGAGGSATVNCDAISDPIDPTALVDDMEAPDFLIPVRAGRNGGGWWAGGDAESVGADIKPNGEAAAEAIPGGRCGSMYAMRVTGHGYTSWAVLSVSMSYGSVDGGAADLLPFDATGRHGITFWARIGDTSTDKVRIAFSDKYTRPQGGICVEGGSIDDACYDLFTVDLTQLSTTWKPYRIPFNGLAQRNFGLKRPALDVSSIYTIEFAPAPSTTFDFWVDDINFY
jgi:hypothetical protein